MTVVTEAMIAEVIREFVEESNRFGMPKLTESRRLLLAKRIHLAMRQHETVPNEADVEAVIWPLAEKLYVAHNQYHGMGDGLRWNEEPATSRMSWCNLARAAIASMPRDHDVEAMRGALDEAANEHTDCTGITCQACRALVAWEDSLPTPPPVGVSGGLVERLRDQPCAEGTGVCGKCAGCVGYEAAGAITQLEADKAELRAALAEAHAALTDPCIGTYDQDDLDWYRKVDAAVKRIAPLTTGKSHSYEKASKG